MSNWSRETKWRQGNVLCDQAKAFFNFPIESNTVVIIATHDCDLTQLPESEPNVELIIGNIVEQTNGNYTHAKNARKIQLCLGGSCPCWVEFDVRSKITISKEDLSAFQPMESLNLDNSNHSTFQIWLASRYRRSAFPDEFEARLSRNDFKIAEKISKIVKPLGDKITGVFFDVDDGIECTRLEDDDTYTLDITLLYDPDISGAMEAAQKAAEDIQVHCYQKLFNPTHQWKAIELRYCEAISESVLSYKEFKNLKRWRLDHLSIGSIPQQSLVQE